MAHMSEEELVAAMFPKCGDDNIMALKEAALQTVELRRVLVSFRTRCFRSREEGCVFEMVESWYVQKFANWTPIPKALVDRNPYAKFKEENLKPRFAALYPKLDFLLDDIPVRQGACRFRFKDDNGVMNVLVTSLSTDENLASLIQPSPYLTHDENVAIAVLDVRMWLNRSPLPVVLGGGTSYADMHMKPVQAVRDDKPSTFHVALGETAVLQYWSKERTPAFNLYHPAPGDLSEQDSYWARLSRVRYPHQNVALMSASKFAALCSKDPYLEDDFESLLEDWETSETKSMYKLLAELLFDKMVE